MVSMITATEFTMEMWCKLIIFVIPIDVTSLILGYNESVINNFNLHSRTLKKNQNFTTYHQVKEAVSSGEINVAHISRKVIPYSLLSKTLGTQKNYSLLNEFLF